MLTAYFDDSGSLPDTYGFGIGGYVAEADAWLSFSDRWTAVLRAFGQERFHMREFAHSVGSYSEWKGNEGRRRAFLSQLVKVARAHLSYGACSTLLVPAFDHVDAEYMLAERTPPYVMCALRCVDISMKWAYPRGWQKDDIRFVFEDAAKIPKASLRGWMEREGFASPTFEPKQRHKGFEIADFWAWEHVKVIKRVSELDFSPFRRSLQALNKIPHKSGIFTEGHLLDFCLRNAIPKRSYHAKLSV